ncbi:dTDP-4-dehydrorhamnose reductase [Treponema socranskii subsp. socranskii VPI DR56BR1116 = ATCC 35536]|uniref:dTDP-4-dehydrorhamnose reductase n=1 Tax=Treponema socranskii subsp. socranskii VPI DR56BR1116 = ATCC 35536 TaxID=1125725 RepID=U2L2L1_TRESO|nr:dTDP-4-dehydrorhamnose reductase [Treponema socranskii]ERF61136.1 dTDP-4-dehydrorhamnose reductase [Treponema socranskii subsp. socranskii VPI DR56BR1116 = ATCC 35536]ERK04977.1 dTDP-4-dehydrorhamnose reductase [Treponema socranskii subsp. socranskii VPI DR56BR1116 = ATCC 35536]
MLWLIGCKGMLGREFAHQLSEKRIPFVGTGSDVDIAEAEKLDAFVDKTESASYYASRNDVKKDNKIDWIINCAAYTAVDNAEDEAEKAYRTNCTGALNIARTARSHGAKLVHISTDYVFDGKGRSPYTEDAPKSPINIYGKTKAESEDLIAQAMTQYYIIRTSWLYGSGGRNFVYTMTRAMNERESVSVVNDQRGTPTFCGDLVFAVIKLIKKEMGATSLFGKKSAAPYGIYHFSNSGEATWFEFACAIRDYGKKYEKIMHDCKIQPCSSDEYKTKAARPSYSVLDCTKIETTLGIKIPSWQVSLERFIKSGKFES